MEGVLEGVLDELRKGIERLDEARRLAKDEQESKGLTCGSKPKSPFAETLATLMRLSSSYRRCYWKSGSEMMFPNIEEEAATPILKAPPLGFPMGTSFASQNVYSKPSAFIRALIEALPDGETLTRDQMLFMAAFAFACDCAWEDENKPPTARRVHHMLLLGQVGSGKTHVVEKLVHMAECVGARTYTDGGCLFKCASEKYLFATKESTHNTQRVLHAGAEDGKRSLATRQQATSINSPLGQGEGAGYRGN